MLPVPIQGGGTYCIDTTEVSYISYNTFNNANPPPSVLPAYCAWNPGWTPTGDWPYTTNSADPVRFVNWCQAWAYCNHLNRHLCGAISGGSIPQANFNDSATDQWFNACSAENNNAYPYGNTYGDTTCNGDNAPNRENSALASGPVASQYFSLCVGGEPLLFQMSGNVAEWEDSCDTAGELDAGASDAGFGALDNCAVRGGSFKDDPTHLRCDSGQTAGPVTQPRNYTGRDVGFRCCI
jgi:formylglycine-generating enzyme required for sulfatase activity